MTADMNDCSAAEQQLLDAISAHETCDFADGASISPEEMGSWGPERTVRASLLRELLTARQAEAASQEIELRGAVIEGTLDLRKTRVSPLALRHCRIHTLRASGATFTGDAHFDMVTFVDAADFSGANFARDAGFDRATFIGAARFRGATFTGTARFNFATITGDAGFDRTTFSREAQFAGVAFTGPAGFGRATFDGSAGFHRATFKSVAHFTDATFAAGVTFDGVAFNSDAGFVRAIVTGNASFTGATFAGDAWFGSATFAGDAGFARATFIRAVRFEGAVAGTFRLSGAEFHSADAGPWVAANVLLAGAVFHSRTRVAVAAVEIDGSRLQAREGVHLVAAAGAVDLTDAEFLRRSILAHSADEKTVRWSAKRNADPHRPDQPPLTRHTGMTARPEAVPLVQLLGKVLGSPERPRSRVVSLRRATAGDLVLSGVDLQDCGFAGAHGLDKLRIDATCSYGRPPRWWVDTLRPFTRRRIIAEEARWRQTHTAGWGPSTAADAPTAAEIAGLYRDLRKGLEDSKDEPGAADFYYGEMEMRRLAMREHRGRRHIAPDQQQPSWVEHLLLDAYWALSGYGLRAWRALASLAVLLTVCAALFTLPVFAYPPDPPSRVAAVDLRTGAVRYEGDPESAVGRHTTATFGKAFEFTARESLFLTRSGTPVLATTGWGSALDIGLRLLAPLLLGLAVLAVRGRTKR